MSAEDFTHGELGALLMAVGRTMKKYDLCVGAAMDGLGNREMVEYMSSIGIDEARAEELVQLDMASVIEVVHLDR